MSFQSVPFPLGARVPSQFTRFVAIGALATSCHFATLWLLVQFAQPATHASAIGFAVGAALSYGLNRRYTFMSRAAHRAGLPKFLAVAGAGLLLNTLIMSVLVGRIGAHYLVAQGIATALVLLWNYLGNRFWTFRERRP